MFTKKLKRGVTLVELLAGVVLMGLLTTLVTTITLFVSRGTKIVSENSMVTHTSSDVSLIILNKLTTMTVTDCVEVNSGATRNVTFSSSKQNIVYIDDTGEEKVRTLYVDSISESDKALWKGPTSITFSIDSTNNGIHMKETDIYGVTRSNTCKFENSTVIDEDSYVTIANSENDNSWFFEIKVNYKTNHGASVSTYYTSIYVTDNDKNN